MAAHLKRHVIKKVYESIYSKTKLATIDQIAPHIVIGKYQDQEAELQVNFPVSLELENEREYQSFHFHGANIDTDNFILGTSRASNGNLKVTVNRNELVKDVLESNPLKVYYKPPAKKLVVEFSSPNIAKPFHVGHLRSTIIGNFIGNVKEKLGHDVVRINFLGDWGTHFGFLKVGLDNNPDAEAALAKNPVKALFNAYVWANREAETDTSIREKAMEESRKLEEQDPESIQSWKKFRELSTKDLEQTYSRLGVRFDDYHWESSYGKKEVEGVLERLHEQGLLRTDEKGRQCAFVRGQAVPLVRSDGASLYLARDAAAALHRRHLTSFNEMLYVVENGQSHHFQSLFAICRELGLDQSWNMRHVKFGRIQGMSTRKGEGVFLHDILDQARDIVLQKLKEAKTTKVEPTPELADSLGCSAVIVNDLKQRRVKDYDFDWDKALQVSGDSLIRLQYTHCRLCSLLDFSEYTPADSCDPASLAEPEAVALVFEIARYEEAILRCNVDLEACVLVTYLFHLAHTANKAFKVLPVKGSGGHVGSQRLLLFNSCKKVLGDGLKLLGVTPLERM